MEQRKNLEKAIHEIINKSTEQIRYCLGYDSFTTDQLIKEIKEEKNPIGQLSKFIHLLVDRLTIRAVGKNPQVSKALIEAINKIHQNNPESPTEIISFIQWVPNQMNDLTAIVEKFQKRISICQSQLHEMKHSIGKENEILKSKLRKMKDLNKIRENNLNKIKAELSDFGNSLLQKEKELNNSDKFILRSKLDESERSIQSLQLEVERLKTEQSQSFDSNDLLQTQVSILQTENISLKKSNQQLQQKLSTINESDLQLSSLLQEKEIENISIQTKYNDLQKRMEKMETEIEALKKENKKLDYECVRIETEKMKLKDQLNITLEKINNNEKEINNIQQIGFLLADALCQRYNPSIPKLEIERLIEVVRKEHIELTETERVKLNPFEVKDNVEYPKNFKTIFSQFDDLNNNIIS